MTAAPVDCVYIAASAHDGRFTRICVASVRRFYPDVPIRILPGGPLEPGLMEELRRFWGVGLADIPARDYGWGYVKLEPLFGPAGERFLVLDSDTVLTGPVLDIWAGRTEPFLVDDEQQTEADTQRLYYDWRKLQAWDEAAEPPRFVFNSGQWFGTAGLLTREDFDRWVEWSVPPRLRHGDCFMPGDQGVLNYVINRKVTHGGLAVARANLMRWPGHGMEGLDAKTVASGDAASLVVHWAGLKKARLRYMPGADLLALFEREYYARLPAGQLRQSLAEIRRALGAAWARGRSAAARRLQGRRAAA